jgi:nucleoid DNA-binding protein
MSKDNNMNKSELVSFIAELNDISKTEAEKTLNMITGAFVEALGSGHDISLVGFGAFKIKHRAAREGRNPKTGEKMNIGAYNQVVFSPGKTMKDSCNS